jgi:hypothetical protein
MTAAQVTESGRRKQWLTLIAGQASLAFVVVYFSKEKKCLSQSNGSNARCSTVFPNETKLIVTTCSSCAGPGRSGRGHWHRDGITSIIKVRARKFHKRLELEFF